MICPFRPQIPMQVHLKPDNALCLQVKFPWYPETYECILFIFAHTLKSLG